VLDRKFIVVGLFSIVIVLSEMSMLPTLLNMEVSPVLGGFMTEKKGERKNALGIKLAN